jgi:primosomal protein N' (replication factor Y)
VRPIVCTGCGATRFKVLRSGVSKVRDELEALLGTPVAEVAGPSREGEDPLPATSVLIGTEAVLHRVRRAAAVVFLDFDQHLLAARFVAAEQALALLARAGRMVGGRGMVGSGPVLVQTRVPDHEVLLAAVHGDPAALTRHELELRRQLDLPPFAALALVSGPAAAGYCRDLSGAGAPPAGLSVADLGGDRWLIRATDHRALCDALAAVPRPPGRLRVAVDPIDV